MKKIIEKNPLAIKDLFRDKRVWVNWLLETNEEGKTGKIPYKPKGGRASSTDPQTWNTLQKVEEAQENFNGIGFVFSSEIKVLGIDLDHCLSVDGNIESEVFEAVYKKANSYTEVSPSGTGLHIYLLVEDHFPLLANKKKGSDERTFECYNEKRFFTFTGNIFRENLPVRTISVQEANEILALAGYPWKKETTQSTSFLEAKFSNNHLIERMFNSRSGQKIKNLWSGDISEYKNDYSAADIGLCHHLAFWTGRNASQMESMWLESQLGQREKTQKRKDYRDRTILASIKNCTEVYKPREEKSGDEKKIPVYIPAISHAELIGQEFPPVRFTVEPFFEQGTMNMLSAPPNTWKSWLLFVCAVCIAQGALMLGKFSTEKTNVMIVNEEDSARLIQDRLRLLGITDTSLGIFYRIAQGSKIEEKFIDSLIKEAKEKNVGVIMFDSLRAVHEADENSSTEMQKIMDLFKKITRQNITVIFTHHHRKKAPFSSKNDSAESSRGSTAINAAVSGHISLDEIDKDGQKFLVISHLKSKVGEKIQPFDILITTGPDSVNFQYVGEHQASEQALTEAKSRILSEVQERAELLGRKDFINLKVGGATTIKEATAYLEKEGKIKVMTRKEAEKAGLKIFSPEGKSNEKLYTIKKDTADEEFDNF